MKKRMSVILALTMAATTMFSAVPAMAKDGDVVNITIWSPTDREQVEALHLPVLKAKSIYKALQCAWMAFCRAFLC